MEMRALAGTQFFSGLAGGIADVGIVLANGIGLRSGIDHSLLLDLRDRVHPRGTPALPRGDGYRRRLSAGVIVFAAITLVNIPEWSALARFRLLGEVAIAAVPWRWSSSAYSPVY